jgi:hypothetical protein
MAERIMNLFKQMKENGEEMRMWKNVALSRQCLDILETIDDVEIRAMARMRFIKNMKWEDIGEQVHLDRTVCSKKVRKYLQGMEL